MGCMGDGVGKIGETGNFRDGEIGTQERHFLAGQELGERRSVRRRRLQRAKRRHFRQATLAAIGVTGLEKGAG